MYYLLCIVLLSIVLLGNAFIMYCFVMILNGLFDFKGWQTVISLFFLEFLEGGGILLLHFTNRNLRSPLKT